MKRAAIGISAHLGWAATATLGFLRGEPRVLRTDRIETAPAGDREALEPYHVAGGFSGLGRVPRPGNPEAALRRGLQKQRRFTARSLGALAKALAETDHELRLAGLLVSRGRPAAEFAKAVGSHTQVHIEEGIAVRASVAAALVAAGARVHELDQKSLAELARSELGAAEPTLLKRLGALRPENDGAWRKEEKRAALAAWVAWQRGR